MLLVTTEQIRGWKLQELGTVQGTTVRSVHLGKDIMFGFKTLVGGKLTSYNGDEGRCQEQPFGQELLKTL